MTAGDDSIKRALLICAPSPVEIGPAPIGTVKVAHEMLARGWEIDILGFRWNASGPTDDFFRRLLGSARLLEAEGFFGKPAGWVPKAVRSGRHLLATQKYDILISFSHLTWSHVVGLLLSRSFKIPWVAFSSDPWSNHTLLPKPQPRRACERWLEHSTYRAATALVFTCPQLQAWMLSQFPNEPDLQAKSFNVPYFFNPTLFPLLNPHHSTSRFVMRHVGTIPPCGYVPAFLRALRRLLDEGCAPAEHLTVSFHGGYGPNPVGLVRELGLEHLVEFHPSVDYPASLRLMNDGDALLFFGLPPAELGGLGNATLHVKFCDYIGASRPIFALAGSGSPAYEALTGTSGLCSSDDPAIVAKTLRAFLDAPDLPSQSVRESFHRDHVEPLWERVFRFATRGQVTES